MPEFLRGSISKRIFFIHLPSAIAATRIFPLEFCAFDGKIIFAKVSKSFGVDKNGKI